MDRIDRICRIEEREARAPAQPVIGPDEDAKSIGLGGELQGVVVGKRAGARGVRDGDLATEAVQREADRWRAIRIDDVGHGAGGGVGVGGGDAAGLGGGDELDGPAKMFLRSNILNT